MGEWRETYRSIVFPWHCDQFGHMNVRWFAHHFDDAAFHIWSVNGITMQMMTDADVHTVVAQTTIDYVREIKAGELLRITSAFVHLGNSSVVHLQRMVNPDTDTLHATQRTVEVFFDPETRRSAPIPPTIRAKLQTALVEVSE